ncbi:MAG TPA: hypothetical protein VH257_20675 [Chloroflexota bacterium]|nr:hypothetical protein [Chloroflexota bacterium]
MLRDALRIPGERRLRPRGLADETEEGHGVHVHPQLVRRPEGFFRFYQREVLPGFR